MSSSTQTTANEAALASDPYQRIKDFIAAAIDQRQGGDVPDFLRPSDYWGESFKYSEYVRTLPPDELKRIRYHTWHLTSDHYQIYYFGTDANKRCLLEEYDYLSGMLEGPAAFAEDDSGIGFDTDRGKLSIDLVRYLLVLVDLVRHGPISADGPRTVLEIGGGYGGLARLCMDFNPATAYVILDLAETLFFSAVNLTNAFGADRVVLCDRSGPPPSAEPGRFYLVPQSRHELVRPMRFDLAINQQSMQEMNQQQVSHYCDILAATTGQFYTCNLHHHSQKLRDETGIVTDLNDALRGRFPEVVWDSEKAESCLTRFIRRHPSIGFLHAGAKILGSQNARIARAYRGLTGRPLRQFSDARLQRLILRCRPG